MNSPSISLPLQSLLPATTSARDAGALGAAVTGGVANAAPPDGSGRDFSGALQDAHARRDNASQRADLRPETHSQPARAAEAARDDVPQPRADGGAKAGSNSKTESRVKSRIVRRNEPADAGPADPQGRALPSDGRILPPASVGTSPGGASPGARAEHSDAGADPNAVQTVGDAALLPASLQAEPGAVPGRTTADLLAAVPVTTDVVTRATAGAAPVPLAALPSGAALTTAAAKAASADSLAVQASGDVPRAEAEKTAGAAALGRFAAADSLNAAATAVNSVASAVATDPAVLPARTLSGSPGKDAIASPADVRAKDPADAAAVALGRAAADAVQSGAAGPVADTLAVAAAAVPGSALPAAVTTTQTALAEAAGRDAKVQQADGSVPSPATADAASMAGSLQPGGASSTGGAAADAPVFKLHQGLESSEFPQALAERVSWLVDKDLGSAKLQINPPQLGPIDVRVDVQGDKAQVWLSAHSVVTRDVLEASSAKLRDMLGAQGFTQVSVDISQRSFQERPAPAPRFDWTPAAVNSAADPVLAPSDARTRLAKQGALDAYA